jgi:hypothetical protein
MKSQGEQAIDKHPWAFYNKIMNRRVVFFLLFSGFISVQLNAANTENISNSPYPSEDVSIAINAAGEIGAVWVEKFSGGNQQVYSAIRRNGQWSSPESIRGQSGINAFPRIARGTNGGFVAAWHDQTSECIRFSQYQGSWSTPIIVSQIGGYDMGSPSITTTTNGRIAVAWTRGNPTFPDAWVTIYQNGWSSPVNISNTYFGSKYCDLTYGPNGEIFAVWQDNLYLPNTGEDFFYTLMSNDRGSGSWTQPEIIDNLNAWTFRPVVAVNSRNDILACFYYMQGSSYWSVSRLDDGWQSPQVISDACDHMDHNLYFSGVCPFGDGFLYIYRDCGRNIIYTTVLDGKPGASMSLSSSNSGYHPSIDYSSSIGAAAAWTDQSGNCDVYVQIFNPQGGPPGEGVQPPVSVQADYRNIPLTPVDLKAELVINRNLFTVQYFWKISWVADSRWSDWKINLVKYRIYRKLKTSGSWELLAEVDPAKLFHIDKDGVSREDRFDYNVLGVDDLGNEFYAYNRISWAPNQLNTDRKIIVQNYNIYRKSGGQPSASYTFWKTVDAATFAWEDHSIEIRQQTKYDYALTSVSDTGKESGKAEALKITTSTYKEKRL